MQSEIFKWSSSVQAIVKLHTKTVKQRTIDPNDPRQHPWNGNLSQEFPESDRFRKDDAFVLELLLLRIDIRVSILSDERPRFQKTHPLTLALIGRRRTTATPPTVVACGLAAVLGGWIPLCARPRRRWSTGNVGGADRGRTGEAVTVCESALLLRLTCTPFIIGEIARSKWVSVVERFKSWGLKSGAWNFKGRSRRQRLSAFKTLVGLTRSSWAQARQEAWQRYCSPKRGCQSYCWTRDGARGSATRR